MIDGSLPHAHSSFQINLYVEDDIWLREIDTLTWIDKFKRIASRCAELLKLNSNFEIDVTLTNSDEIREINKTFRNKDISTNVLTFPLEEQLCNKYDDNLILLGDIVLSYNDISNESILYDKAFLHRSLHLYTHGVFHLLGYNHDTDDARTRMEALEQKVLSSFGIENIYAYETN